LIGNEVEKMANSLRAKLSKLRHDGNITDAEYQELIKKLDGHDAEIRVKVIDEFAERLKDSLVHKYRHLLEIDTDGFEWLTTDAVGTHIDEIAESMKGEKE
jgi:hypothetical protein